MNLQRTIGLLGGMSWHSTAPYYELINRRVAERLGKLHSAQILLWSTDFQLVEELQVQGRWEEAGELLGDAAARLERAGAHFLVLCTNTMHKVADVISAHVEIPLLHIADPTAGALRSAGISTVGLLGTRFTMEESFYRERLQATGPRVLVPMADDRQTIDKIIYEELCSGTLLDRSREKASALIDGLVAQGAEAVVLGCTELSLLIKDSPVPLFDTTALHALAAADLALEPACQ
jgi:amino-acid racemase